MTIRSGQIAAIYLIEPAGYLGFLHLMSKAEIAMSDSGGIQEETTILSVPCVTLRKNTERPVTITKGTNILAGIRANDIVADALKQLSVFGSMGEKKGRKPVVRETPPLWVSGRKGCRGSRSRNIAEIA